MSSETAHSTTKISVDLAEVAKACYNVALFTLKGNPTDETVLLEISDAGVRLFATDNFIVICFSLTDELPGLDGSFVAHLDIAPLKALEKEIRSMTGPAELAFSEGYVSIQWAEEVRPISVDADDSGELLEIWEPLIDLIDYPRRIEAGTSFNEFAVSPERLARLARVKTVESPIDFQQQRWSSRDAKVSLLGFKIGPRCSGILTPMNRDVVTVEPGSLW